MSTSARSASAAPGRMAAMSAHMTPEQFRRHGYEVVDWIESLPVLSQAEPGAVRAALPAEPPEQGEPFDAVLRDLDEVILPGITHWQHPSFFAYFPANASGPAILRDLLASLFDLPAAFRGNGVIQHTASDAALVALVAALHRVSGGSTEHNGVHSGRFAVYTSAQTHSSVEKACRVAGLGADALRKIDIDPATQAARSEHLRALVE